MQELLDGWTDALGQILADARREWRRERDLAMAEIRAEMAAQIVALNDRIDARAAELRAMSAAPEAPAEPEAPDDIAPLIAKAMALLAEPPPAAPAPPPAVVNVTVPLPPPRTEKTRVTKHDDKGRIIEIERDVA